jgi:D-glycero-beta-D-manno-heptose 1-phosphate adenylyltransferase
MHGARRNRYVNRSAWPIAPIHASYSSFVLVPVLVLDFSWDCEDEDEGRARARKAGFAGPAPSKRQCLGSLLPKSRCLRAPARTALPRLNLKNKLIAPDQLPAWRAAFRASGRKLVVTNGCFDLLHLGHVTYLTGAHALGDALLIGLNSDASVGELKGPARPLNPEEDRALVLAALSAVDAVSIFPERSAAHFLERAQPDIYVKGGDYTLDTINQEERRIVESAGGRIVILPLVPGRSTSALLEKIAQL